MLSQKESKLIQSLEQKKFRQKYNLFVVEGKKLSKEILNSHFEIEKIYHTENLEYPKSQLISGKDMKKISHLKNPSSVLTLVKIPAELSPQLEENSLVLDAIQDPGNLGTIIRTADWFGVSQIICSPDTVDLYNPKVIQATMGSFTRVKIIYTDIQEFINKFKGQVYAADMEGISIYQENFSSPFALVMGNEGHGISTSILQKTKVITIPPYHKNAQIESLNVSIATAIILSEIRK